MSLSLLSNSSFIGAVGLKSISPAAIYGLIYKYFHGTGWKDPILIRAALGPLTSVIVSELIMTSIIQRLTEKFDMLYDGIKRIFDQGLNASLSRGISIKANELLILNIPNLGGGKWRNHEEFLAQFIADIVGEILSHHYIVPLFGLNKSSIVSVYG